VSATQSRARGDLEIVSETVMVAIPRGDNEELRVSFTKGRTAEGKDIAWHGIRVFWKTAEGEWRPGKAGVTIRGKELHAVAIAFLRACASAIPSDLHEPTKRIVAALNGGRAS
jgi:hypothetical protein